MKTYYYTVDFSKVKYYGEIHEVLERALDFPKYYGGNLDALNDCLTDMLSEKSFIEIKGFDDLDERFDGSFSEILNIFKRTKHIFGEKFEGRFNVTLIYKDGRREMVK